MTTSVLHHLRTRRRDSSVIYILLIVGAALWLFPLVVAVRASIAYGGFHNYLVVLTTEYNGVRLPRALINSLVIAVMHAVLVCGVGSLAGYAFSKIRFPGRDSLFYGSLIFLSIPGVAIIVPLYYITGKVHLFNNPLGVALPEAALTLPFAVLLLRNYAKGIPDDLIAAAQMDRATHFRIFRSIFLPLCRPALINLAALCVLWSAQDFLIPSLVMKKPELTTASQAVLTIQQAFGPTPTETSQFFAALVLLALPAVILIVGGLRYIKQGITAGGVKE